MEMCLHRPEAHLGGVLRFGCHEGVSMGMEELMCGARGIIFTVWVEVEGPGRRRRMRRAARSLGELGERTRSVSRARGRERLKTMGAVAMLASGEGEESEQCGRLEPGKGVDPGGLSRKEI